MKRIVDNRPLTLEYIWVKNYKCFGAEPAILHLTGRFSIEFDENERTFRKLDLNKDYFSYTTYLMRESSPVKDYSIIVGSNGSGKTSIFSLLFAAFCSGEIDRDIKNREAEYIFLFSSSDTDCFYYKARFLDLDGSGREEINRSPNVRFPEGKKGEKLSDEKLYGDEISMIYYSPHFTTEYPLPEILCSPSQYDISTSRYLLNDIKEFENQPSPEACINSQITGHRRMDAKRIVEFIADCEKEKTFDEIKEVVRVCYPGSIVVSPRDVKTMIKAWKMPEDLSTQDQKLVDWAEGIAKTTLDKCYLSAFIALILPFYTKEATVSEELNEILQNSTGNLNSCQQIIEKALYKFAGHTLIGDRAMSTIKILEHLKNGCSRLVDEKYSCFVFQCNQKKSWSYGHQFMELVDLYRNAFINYDFMEWYLEPHISSGEYCQLGFFSRLYGLFFSKDLNSSLRNAATGLMNRCLILCLDEIETALHPRLQQTSVLLILRFLDKLLRVSNTDSTCHVIFSSHSPFLLSDFPRKNVLRLDSGKVENDGFPTFASNIYDLYRDSFFMGDSFIGEFAQTVIRKTVDERDSDKANAIVDEIADPVMKVLVKDTIIYLEKHSDMKKESEK